MTSLAAVLLCDHQTRLFIYLFIFRFSYIITIMLTCKYKGKKWKKRFELIISAFIKRVNVVLILSWNLNIIKI
jgi:hypothetical protein